MGVETSLTAKGGYQHLDRFSNELCHRWRDKGRSLNPVRVMAMPSISAALRCRRISFRLMTLLITAFVAASGAHLSAAYFSANLAYQSPCTWVPQLHQLPGKDSVSLWGGKLNLAMA